MKRQSTPYQTFPFGVTLHVPGKGKGMELGGFSEVSGLGAETVIAEHGSSDSLDHDVRKVGRLHKTSRVTLKRGLINASEFSEWMAQSQTHDTKVRCDLIITMRDGHGHPIQRWKLQAVLPQKHTGPALPGKGNDVVIEELVLSHEGIEAISEEPPESNFA